MTLEDSQKLEELAELTQQHKELDMRLEALIESLNVDQLEISRLKKKKLRIKDQMNKLRRDLIPDQPA